MLQKFNLLLVVLIILAAGSVAFSQDSNRRAPPKPTPNQRAEMLLVALEQIPARIMARRTIQPRDTDEFSKIGLSYAVTMKTQFEEVLKSTENTATTQGREGNISLLEDFEKFAESHARRLTSISNSYVEIERRITSKEIGEAPNDGESSFLLLMQPQVSDVKFVRSSFDFTDNVFTANLNDGGCNSVNNFSSTNLLPRSSVALPCLIPCRAKNWSVCATCITNVVGGLPSNWNSFQNCWNGCSGNWWKKSLCQSGCLLKFIAWVA